MKKIFSLLCVCLACSLVSVPGIAAKGGSCSPTKAIKLQGVKLAGRVVGGGIGWATGGAVGASLAPFALIGRGGIDPVVGTLRINGTILAGFVGGAAVGSYAGGKIAGKVYSGQDYLCYNSDPNNCLQCDVPNFAMSYFGSSPYECGDEHVVFGPGFAFRCNSSLNPFVQDVWEEFSIPNCSGNKIIKDGCFDIDVRSSLVKTHASMPGWMVVNRDVCASIDCCSGWHYNSADQVCVQDGGCEPIIKGTKRTVAPGNELISVELNASECSALFPGRTYDAHGIYHFKCENGGVCKLIKCDNGAIPSVDGKCVKNNPNPPKPGKKTCREEHKNDGDKRLACCDVETSGTGYWGTDKECHCNDSSHKFEIVNTNHGQCTGGGTVGPVGPNCPSDAYPDGGTCMCNNPDMTYNKAKNLCECPGDTNKVSNECRCKEKNKVLKNGQCEWSDEYLASLKMDIETWYSEINGLTASFEVSEWKNAEGKFNTARLASDSIAGVVLGTVGGVVTAQLVKKAQVKQGFEDIQCHIGGQSVADYGDGFVVGR